MRSILTAVFATCGLVIAPSATSGAAPGVCPPICDAIPDSAWIAPTALPLYAAYHWPGLAGLAVTAHAPQFTFEEVCATPTTLGDARDYAVAAEVTVTNPAGHWQLRAQIMHWRGDTAHGGPTASRLLEVARTQLRDCQVSAPQASPSVTTSDPQRLAAVISVAGQRVIHQFVLADPASATVVGLAMWSTLPPVVGWPAVADAQVLDAMAAPLCDAYLGSCR